MQRYNRTGGIFLKIQPIIDNLLKGNEPNLETTSHPTVNVNWMDAMNVEMAI